MSIIVLLLLTVSCGLDDYRIVRGTNGENCYDNIGDRNVDGRVGVDDCVGVDGSDGAQGPAGAPGKTGPAGETGKAGERGGRGDDGESGEDGSDGLDGDTGSQGDDGPQGPAGEDGEDYTDELVYEGYFCSRTVVSLGDTTYVMHGQLVPLSDKWYKINNNCSLRYVDGYIEEDKT